VMSKAKAEFCEWLIGRAGESGDYILSVQDGSEADESAGNGPEGCWECWDGPVAETVMSFRASPDGKG